MRQRKATEVSPIKEEEDRAVVPSAQAIVVGGNGNIRQRKKLSRATRDWSCLPQPAAQLILMDLRLAVGDTFSFAGVCKVWRSVFNDCKRELFSSLPPLLVICCSLRDALGGFHSLVEQRFFHRKQPIPMRFVLAGCGLPPSNCGTVFGVSHGYWIILTTCLENSKLRRVFLMDPLLADSRIELPPASHIRLGKTITMHGFCRALMAAPPTSPDCVVVVAEMRCIWYCRPGDAAWVCHGFSGYSGPRHRLVAVIGPQLYALVQNGKLLVMELLFPQPRVSIVDMEYLPLEPNGYLLESDGEILHIADEGGLGEGGELYDGRPLLHAHRYVVRRLDLPARRWVTLDTIGKRCIFLPPHWRGAPLTCVGAARWGGREDCIYSVSDAKTLVVWSMKDSRVVECHPFPEMRIVCDWLVPSFCYG